MATVYTNSYNDKGQDTPSLTISASRGQYNRWYYLLNGGIWHLKNICIRRSKQSIKTILFRIGDRITDFSWSAIGGGYIDIYKDDGQVLGHYSIPGGIIVFKDNAIYKFSFADDGTQLLEEITRAFGGISFRSIKHVENDIIFLLRKMAD